MYLFFQQILNLFLRKNKKYLFTKLFLRTGKKQASRCFLSGLLPYPYFYFFSSLTGSRAPGRRRRKRRFASCFALKGKSG